MKDLIRYCKGLRTSSNGPHFIIALTTLPDCIESTMSTLKDEGLQCQCAYIKNIPGIRGE